MITMNMLMIVVTGMSDDEVKLVIAEAVRHKKKSLGGFDTPQQLAEHRNRPMILIGG